MSGTDLSLHTDVEKRLQYIDNLLSSGDTAGASSWAEDVDDVRTIAQPWTRMASTAISRIIRFLEKGFLSRCRAGEVNLWH